MNVLYDERSRHVVEFAFVNVKNFVRHLQAVSIGRAAVQLNFAIATLHQYYDIALQLHHLLQMGKSQIEWE